MILKEKLFEMLMDKKDQECMILSLVICSLINRNINHLRNMQNIIIIVYQFLPCIKNILIKIQKVEKVICMKVYLNQDLTLP